MPKQPCKAPWSPDKSLNCSASNVVGWCLQGLEPAEKALEFLLDIKIVL